MHAILNSQQLCGYQYYLVDWEGYSPKGCTWELASHVHTPNLVGNSTRLTQTSMEQHHPKQEPEGLEPGPMGVLSH